MPDSVLKMTLAVLAVLIFAGFGNRETMASECIVVPTSESITTADVIYTGRVTTIRVGPQFAWPEIEFDVHERLKGPVSGKTFVLQTPNGKGMDCEGFDFVVGKDYLVFAAARYSVTGQPRTYGVGSYQGTALLDSDEGKQRLRATRRMIRK